MTDLLERDDYYEPREAKGDEPAIDGERREFRGRCKMASAAEILVRADLALKEAITSANELVKRPAYPEQVADLGGCIERAEKGRQQMFAALGVLVDP
jgi:hypothetical protein